MHKGQGVSAGIGAGMFAIFLATAQMHFFGSPTRPVFVFWLMVGSGLVWAACAIVWLKFHLGAPSGSAQPLQSVANGDGDRIGPQLSAGRDLIVTPETLRGFLPVQDPPPEPLPIAATSATEEHVPTPPAPQLVILGPQKRMMLQEMGTFVLANGILGAVLYIENPEVRGDRSPAVRVRNVVAVVRFSSLDGKPLGKIARAFWLKRIENKIDIDPGHQEIIVIGLFRSGVLEIFNNTRIDPFPRNLPVRHRMRILENLSHPLEPDFVILDHCVRVDISIITADGQFLAEGKYRICTNAKNDDFSFEDEV